MCRSNRKQKRWSYLSRIYRTKQRIREPKLTPFVPSPNPYSNQHHTSQTAVTPTITKAWIPQPKPPYYHRSYFFISWREEQLFSVYLTVLEWVRKWGNQFNINGDKGKMKCRVRRAVGGPIHSSKFKCI